MHHILLYHAKALQYSMESGWIGVAAIPGIRHGMYHASPRLVADLLYERAAVLLPAKRVFTLVQSDVEPAQRAFRINVTVETTATETNTAPAVSIRNQQEQQQHATPRVHDRARERKPFRSAAPKRVNH